MGGGGATCCVMSHALWCVTCLVVVSGHTLMVRVQVWVVLVSPVSLVSAVPPWHGEWGGGAHREVCLDTCREMGELRRNLNPFDD